MKLKRMRAVSTTVALAYYLSAISIAQSFDGLQATNPLLHPGMLDFYQQVNDGSAWTNLALWTPVFRGGAGRLAPDHGPPIDYGGGFLRALAAAPQAGDLILAGQTLRCVGVAAWEAQAEYRLPAGVLLPGSLGVGGGYVARDQFGPDIRFAKLSYRDELGVGWRAIASVQSQEVGHATSPGGYAALYNSQLMFAGGIDGEQWRTAMGYVHPATAGKVLPAFELFYVDETVGSSGGVKFLLATATLGYQGWGFLSHDSRLGRALGPQGLEFGNPNGFLQPMWNRLFDVAEVGDLLNVRVTETCDAVGLTSRDWQVLGFPFQFGGTRDWKDWLFMGAGLRQETEQADAPYLIGGAIGRPGAFRLAAEGQLDT